MIIDEDEYLAHYGTPRHSGRYPWGSGEQHEAQPRNPSFSDHVKELKRQGMKETDIAKGMGISTTRLRAKVTMSNNEQKQAKVIMAQRLKDKGYSPGAIAKRMGLPGESSVRALLAPGAKDKADVLTNTAAMLKQQVEQHKWVDVGRGVENHINLSQTRFNVALEMLKEQGYKVHNVPVPQLTTGHDTTTKVLALPDTTQNDAWKNRFDIKQISQISDSGGRTWSKPNHPIVSIDPSRLKVVYGNEGGSKMDGLIYVRHGVEDVSLGKARYAQVRVKIGANHYLKGMAMYNDILPKGTDLVFHTAKEPTGNKLDALKPLEPDPDFPFGSVTRSLIVNPGAKDEHVSSAMNIVNEEGQWNKWNRSISAQALSKQSPSLARMQLDRVYNFRKNEYDKLQSLNNPAVRKKLLESYADTTDKSAVHLKAAALERQNWQVILPIESMKPSEIYAPNFHNGEQVALIRYPHGGTFEIPELTVNNRHPEALKLLGDAKDAVGIHHSTAERLSGADFDGDTVLVIPNDKKHIAIAPALEELKGFDPRRLYKNPEGVEFEGNKQHLMGDVSNLITDMTLKGASREEISRAVRHSMVVIDAEKHNLNYKQSAIDFNIKALKEKYQKEPGARGRGGASTLISMAKSKAVVPHRKLRPQSQGGPIDPITGRKVFVPTGSTRRDRNTGLRVPRTTSSTKLAEAVDAHTLSSGTPMEEIYADHSNRLKDLANKARLSILRTPSIVWSPSAKRAYASEVASLNSKLALAKRNSPLERQAQLMANQVVAAKKAANPHLEADSIKKIKFQALEEARTRVHGGKVGKQSIKITDKEWSAIQAGAISNHNLEEILRHADLDRVRELATPRSRRTMTAANVVRAMAMLKNGLTRAEVARQLGVSVSTLDLHTSGDAEEGDR